MRISPFATLAVLVLAVACGGEEPAAKAPSAPEPPKDPPWLAGVARACTRITSCTHAHDAHLRNASTCVDWWLGAPEPLQKCLGAATTCDQVDACLRGGGDARAAKFCSDRPGVVTGCDGERLVSCGDDDVEESTVTDCAALGASCRETRAAGGVVIRACFAPSQCPASAPEARCDGANTVIACHDGAIERTMCRAGTHCEAHKDENGEATASCDLPGSRRCVQRCEGDTLVECGKHVRVTDCAASGLRCTGIGLRAGCAVPSDVECDREKLPKCEGGDSLAFCAAGRSTRIACTSVGMSACDPAARGAVAACVAR